MTKKIEIEVAIIGAGVAGLAAAQKLKSYGVSCILIESRERIGGRVWTDYWNSPIELGAEFIHGAKAATWSVVEKGKLSTEPYPFDNEAPRLYAIDNKLLDTNREISLIVEEIYKQAENYQGPDKSIATYISELTIGDETTAFFVLDKFARIEAADVNKLSAKAIGQERMLNTAGWDNFRITSGYDSIVKWLANDLNIILNKAVKTIEWSAKEGALYLSDGSQVQAKHVIITIPLSLLQLDSICFKPALPKSKRLAINSLAMGNVTKLALRFKKVLWPDFSYLTTNGMVRVWWQVVCDENVALMGYTGGQAALDLATIGNDKAISQGIYELSALFGDEIKTNLLEGKLIDWSSDPWSKGAYSYTPIGALNARQELSYPLEPTLFFAGEATSINGHVGTIHGAIESGWRAADEILESRVKITKSERAYYDN